MKCFIIVLKISIVEAEHDLGKIHIVICIYSEKNAKLVNKFKKYSGTCFQFILHFH